MFNITRWQRPEVASWPSFDRLTDLRDEIDRLFDSPWARFTHPSQLLSGWTPALDVSEDKDNYYVRAELPGMKKEEINLSLHEGCLSLSGERKQARSSGGKENLRTERFFGRFQRSVSFPSTVVSEKVKAQYTDGVLTVTLPKAEEAKPKQIEVNVA